MSASNRSETRLALLAIVGLPLAVGLIRAVIRYTMEVSEPMIGDPVADVVIWTTGVGMLALIGVLMVYAIRQLSGSTALFLAGLLAIFVGERIVGDGTLRWIASGFGVAIIAVAQGVRVFALSRATGRLKQAHRLGLLISMIALVGLAMYALATDGLASRFFSEDDALQRWQGSLTALWPILVLCGTLPVAAIDRLITLHPLRIPPKATRQAALQALSASLAIALVFPVNYLASQNPWDYDAAYFRTTKAGTSTLALVKGLSEPIEATLFFPAGSDVGREVQPYFASLAEASGGMIKVTTVDQALAPALAEEMKVRDNGYITLKMGESTEKFKVGDTLKKAKRELKKLDQTVQKNLLKVAKGQRKAYFITGHGEANFRERDDPLRKLNLFKKVLESQNFRTKNLGVAEGLANAVPDDADLLILAAPDKPLMPEEVETLEAYLDKGGALLAMVDPGGDPMTDLLGHLGITSGTAPLAHSKAHVRQSRGPSDRILLATNRYGSHSSVKTLSKNGTTMAMIFPTVVSLDKTDKPPGKVSTLVRTFPDTWPDANPNREKDGDEVGKVWDIALASTGPEAGEGDPWRAIVVGDVSWASDPVIQFSQANQIFMVDSARWLIGEESMSGEVQNEEDVKIQHTRDEDWVWFYVTVMAVPLMVLGFGFVIVRIRRRNG